MRRLAGVALVLLAACGNSTPSPPATSAATSVATSAATTAPTTAPTSAATTGATSPPTSAATSGPSTSGGVAAACAALIKLDDDFGAFVTDYNTIKTDGAQLLQIADTLTDQGQATVVALIGQDAQDSAQAFLDGDLEKGARLQNRAVATIGPAKVALGCT